MLTNRTAPPPARKPGRPPEFSECTVDPETRQVSYAVTPPCPVEY